MKRSYLLPLAFLLFNLSLSSATNSISLEEAIKKGWVKADISGAKNQNNSDFSDHHGPCITFILQNKSSQHLQLFIENGRFLSPLDSSTQRMVVTKSEMIVMSPGQTINKNIFAMCSQANNGSPDEGENFVLGMIADNEIRQMSQEIEKRNAQNSTGQDAMWVVTDDHDISSITGEDVSLVNSLRQTASQITGKPMELYVPEQTTPSKPLKSVRGTFDFTLPRAGTVTLSLYDAENRNLMDFIRDKQYGAGQHAYSYYSSSSSFEPGFYYIKLFVNREFVAKIRVEIE